MVKQDGVARFSTDSSKAFQRICSKQKCCKSKIQLIQKVLLKACTEQRSGFLSQHSNFARNWLKVLRTLEPNAGWWK